MEGVIAVGSGSLFADDTRRIAADLIGTNKQAISALREQGSCDISYGIAGHGAFSRQRFIQRGSCAIVMRVIPTEIPTLDLCACRATGRRRQRAQRNHSGHRRKRIGKILDARGAD